MNEKVLERLGLSEDEATIYLILLENPRQTVTSLSKTSGFNRPKLYRVLPAMEEAWLISRVIIWRRSYFMAENPKMLSNYFDRLQEDYAMFVPEITRLFSSNLHKPIVKNMSGKSGLKNLFLDIANSLEKKDVFYRYSSRRDMENTHFEEKDYRKYRELRDSKQIGRMVITSEYLNKIKPKKIDKEVVVIPKNIDIFEDNIAKIIYADKIAIVDYNTFEIFVIESAIIANFEKKIFKLLFHFLKTIQREK